MSLSRLLRAFLAETVGALHTRLALFGLEWEQARADLLRQASLMFLGFALMFLSLLLATFFVVLLAWDTPYRIWVVLLLVGLYAAIGGQLLWQVKRTLSDPDGQPFAATLAEISRDAQYLDSLSQGQTDDDSDQEDKSNPRPVPSVSDKDGQ